MDVNLHDVLKAGYTNKQNQQGALLKNVYVLDND